ncbi:MAG: amidohydrolase family protein [Planctomycetia bacterium]|nr:amidohydrolase family protein [Planctomycetia bacterium]
MTTTATTKITGRHYQSLGPVQLEISHGKITGVRELGDVSGQQRLPWIAPGFLDLQTNGFGGQEFSSPDLTSEKVAHIAKQQAAFGVTQFCPTVTTASFDTIVHSLRTIVEACDRFSDAAQSVAGIHLEGPYIAREDGPRGAHPLEHCRAPSWDEFQRFQDAAKGTIRVLTLAVDYPESPAFIARVAQTGVVVAIGHTGANSTQIRAAVDAGARLSTHLGNGAHRMLRRHPNYIWDQLAEDRLMASLIVDGHHLPPEVVQTIVRAKTPERCILVSDLSGLAGLPVGRYATQLCELEILPDGRLVIAGQDQLLAGASQPIGVGVANVMRFAGVDLATAVNMAGRRPAELLGQRPGQLQAGDVADLVLFDLHDGPEGRGARLEVRETLRKGQRVYTAGD